jgi:hypothetical protein
MSQTAQESVDEILERFNSVWITTGPPPHPVVWQDAPISADLQKMIDGADGVELTPYARVTVRSNRRKQTTIGQTGARKFEGNGVLFVEIFTPTGDGLVTTRALAELVRDAFETPNVSSYHTWYGEVRTQENGSEGLWSRITVTAEWNYEQIK